MNDKVKFFEDCIKRKDFNALVYFISTDCKTEEELISVCRKAHNITIDMICELVEEAVRYFDYHSKVMKSAKNLMDEQSISKKNKEKLWEIINEEMSSTTIMGYRLHYFIELIEKELKYQEN